jgi:hypothetical protein
MLGLLLDLHYGTSTDRFKDRASVSISLRQRLGWVLRLLLRPVVVLTLG